MQQLLSFIKQKTVILIAVYTLALTLFFEYSFYEKEFGIGLFIIIASLTGGVLMSLVGNKLISKTSVTLMLVTLFFSFMLVVRDSELLNFFNFITTMLVFLLLSRLLIKSKLSSFTIFDYFISFMIVPWQVIARPFKIIGAYLQSLSQGKKSLILPILKGLIAAVPILVIFGALFSSADSNFNNYLSSLFTFTVPEAFFQHLIIDTVVFILVSGYLYLLQTKDGHVVANESQANELTPVNKNRALELGVFIWPIVTLFYVFIIFQIKYLFSDALTNDLTYAEYARHGFWELLVVTFISLFILLFADLYSRKLTKRLYSFLWPCVLMIIALFVIVASALKRMSLYQLAYGWTLPRFFVIAFIIFLTIVLILFLVKLLMNKTYSYLLFATLVTSLSALVVINMISPDSFVASENIQRYYKTNNIDVSYLLSLSADAVPQLVEVAPKLNEQDKYNLLNGLELMKKRLEERTSRGWTGFNFSRQQGAGLLNSFLNH